MKRIIDKILNEYSIAKTQMFSGHPIGSFFRNDIPNFIYNTGIVNRTTHLITGSVGQGQWATVPWVCIFDKKITTTATKGVYIVYLLAKDGKTLYLTFNQGCTDIRRTHSKRETIELMRKRASEVVSKINSRGFNFDENINLGSGLTELAELYQKGTIFYKSYKRNNVPESLDDLKQMMNIYEEYVASCFLREDKTGKFDSWEIIDDVTAIKTCDKSFFAYNGSGVPKEICWFFDAENIPQGENKSVKLIFKGKEYLGKLTNDTTDRRRIQIRWNGDLAKGLEEYQINNAKAKFVKLANGIYEITMEEGENEMAVTVLDNIIQAMKNIGGKGSYSEIYTAYEELTGQILTDGKKAGIRKIIEDYSSDSDNYKGKEDIFYSMEYNNLNDKQAAAMLRTNAPLNDVYLKWNGWDTGYLEDVWKAVESRANELVRREQQKEKER